MLYNRLQGRPSRVLDYTTDGTPFASTFGNSGRDSLSWLSNGVLTGGSNDGTNSVLFFPYSPGAYYGLAYGKDWGTGKSAEITSVVLYPTQNVGFCGYPSTVNGLYIRLYGSYIDPAVAGYTSGTLLGTSSTFSEDWTNDPGPKTVTASIISDYQYTWAILGSDDTIYLGHSDMYLVEAVFNGILYG